MKSQKRNNKYASRACVILAILPMPMLAVLFTVCVMDSDERKYHQNNNWIALRSIYASKNQIM